MIITTETNEIEQTGLTNSVTASIAVTPEMLALLSSKIYSDKISAFIRELSTNAYDAMVEAGTIEDKTFKVTLPTILNPIFSIRDFGTGLSKEAMYSNFKDYGNGTKASSNMYNGAFGIGSKSPMAYVNDFTIVSYYGGVKTVYIYGKNSVGIPVLSEVHSEASDEHPGLEITLAIQPADIDSVISKAQRIYTFFAKKPECNLTLVYEDLSSYTSFNLKVLDWDVKVYLSKDSKLRVSMANVCYVLPHDSNEVFNQLRNSGLLLEVPTGCLSITPSRETLEASSETIKFFTEFNNVFKDTIISSIDPTKDTFHKLLEYNEIVDSLKGCRLGNQKVKIDNFEFSFYSYPSVLLNTQVKIQRTKTRYEFSSFVHFQRDSVYLHNDKDGFQQNVLDYCFDMLKADKVYVLNDNTVKQLTDKVKGIPITKKSDILQKLTKPKRVRNTNYKVHVPSLDVYNVKDFTGKKPARLQDCVSANGKTFYITTKGDCWYTAEKLPLTNKVLANNELQLILGLIVQANPNIDTIAIVNSSQVRSIYKNPEFVELTKYILENKQEFSKVLDVFTVGLSLAYNDVSYFYSNTKERLIKNYPNTSVGKLLKLGDFEGKNACLVQQKHILQTKFNTIRKVIKELGLTMDKPVEYSIIYAKQSLRLLQILSKLTSVSSGSAIDTLMDLELNKCLDNATSDVKVNDIVCLAYR